MSALPKEKRGLLAALETFQLRLAYHVAAFLAKVFEKPFWFFEQRRTRLADEVERRRT